MTMDLENELLLFIISSPSGAGKTTLTQRLLGTFQDELTFSVSHTTRRPRANEVDGQDYHFTDVERFRALVAEGRFAEWAEVHGNFYGTSVDEIARAKREGRRGLLFDVDYQGARQIKAKFQEAIGIFVSAHPLKDVRDALRVKADVSLAELDTVKDGEWVTAGGIIAAVRQIRTRAGNPMMFVTLDDLEGTVEMIAFEKTILEYTDLLQPDQVVLVRGKVEHGDRGTSIMLSTVEPFEPTQVREAGGHRLISYGTSSYGYDVRCAPEFKVFTNINSAIVDPKRFDQSSLVDMRGDVCIVPPNSFALARSVEYFRIPRNVLTICVGKSTYARCGIICNVTPFEPEWEGHVTLEISNTTPLPAKIYANEGIAQVLFFESDDPPAISYADRGGKYQAQRGVTLPRL